MKRLIDFAFYSGDPVRVIEKGDKYYDMVGEIDSITVRIDVKRKYYLDYVVLFMPAEDKFGNRKVLYAATSLQKVEAGK